MELHAASGADVSLFRVAAALSKVDLPVKEDAAAAEPYLLADGFRYTAKNTMLRAIAQGGKNAAALLGSAPLQKAHVSQWLSFAEHQAPKMATASALDVCNKFLQPRAYLATDSVSLADASVYFALHKAVTDMNESARVANCNVTRWFNQTQHELRAAGAPEDALPAVVEIPLPQPRFPNPEAAAAPSGAAGEGKADKKADKKGADKKGADKKADKKAGKDAASGAADQEMHVGLLDVRVGLIQECSKHEKADKLYVEKIDVGEDAPRNIASGLVGLVPLEEMQNRLVLVLCNMKPKSLVGFKSHGMVLCASNADHTEVEPVKPPAGAKPGDRVVVKGFESDPASPNFVNKKKVIEAVLPDLKTNADGVACFRGVPMGTDKGNCTSRLADATIA